MDGYNDERITTKWYQANALRTLSDFETPQMLCFNAYTGIIGEYGEFFDYLKKLYTHNLDEDKKAEVRMLAPKELGDVMWYLATSLAVYYGYSLSEVYDQITGQREEDYDIDVVYDYVGDRVIYDENLFSEIMKFKKILNKLDDTTCKEDTVPVVSEIILKIAEILRDLFGIKLSDILLANINKLRRRYPEGFSTDVANIRIDANKKYKEEEDTKVQR